MRWCRLITCLLAFFSAFSVSAQFKQPYEWSRSLEGGRLTVQVAIPENAYLYADETAVELTPPVKASETPVAQPHTDEFGTADIYAGGQVHEWVYAVDPGGSYEISIRWQGCGDGFCFPPASETFSVGERAPQTGPKTEPAAERSGSLNELLDRFETVRTDGGVMSPEEFLTFLDTDEQPGSSTTLLEGRSTLVMILLVLLGGLALNLTPCVLPMIPVNLAIIGAGAQAATKKQGFVRGGVYGLGIALAYGALGLFTVLTGSKFGTLNASPVFNFVIALIFLVLALAMFDVLHIDLSRFGNKINLSGGGKRGGLLPAFIMGVVAALLAGACVAPIVIAVLLQATALYAGGNAAGLFLPLLLGIGMALPWPVAGAGLTVLPKPGTWMVKVKHGFGILILLFAAYYAWLGVTLLPGASTAGGHTTEEALAHLETELTDALEQGQPVLIDFWATWCKNCLKMNKTTFKDPAVKERLDDFAFIKFQAEEIGDPRIKALLDRYQLPGLPGYVILRPRP